MLYVVCCMLYVVCCMLYGCMVVCCMLYGVCCLWLLFVVFSIVSEPLSHSTLPMLFYDLQYVHVTPLHLHSTHVTSYRHISYFILHNSYCILHHIAYISLPVWRGDLGPSGVIFMAQGLGPSWHASPPGGRCCAVSRRCPAGVPPVSRRCPVGVPMMVMMMMVMMMMMLMMVLR